jgi:hypothetical protein
MSSLEIKEKKLFDAIERKDYDSVELLLKEGVDPNKKFIV